MKFNEWADKFYFEREKIFPNKDQRDTLRDQIAGRLMLVLMIREWSFDEKHPRYKNRYLYINEDAYVEDDSQNARLQKLYDYYTKKVQEEKNLLMKKEKCEKCKEGGDTKAKEKCEMIDFKLRRVKNTKKAYYDHYIEEKYSGTRIDLFEDVTEEEMFYNLLFKVIGRDGRGKTIYNRLQKGEWWIVPLEEREEILQSLLMLTKECKWYFVEELFEEIAEKIINPKGYLLRSRILDLAYTMDMFDYYVDKEIISFSIPKDSTKSAETECHEITIEHNSYIEREDANTYSVMYQTLGRQVKDVILSLDEKLNEDDKHARELEKELELFERMGLAEIEEEKQKKSKDGKTEV